MPRSREELVEALTELKRREENRAGLLGNSTAMMLTEARDLLESLEERIEHRLVVDQVGGRIELGPQPLADCRARAAAVQVGGEVHAVVFQSRTNFTTPWTDVEEGTGGR